MSIVIDSLSQFEDPRDPKKVRHPLVTILFISICAIFCGAEAWEDIVIWGETHKDWLSEYVDMSQGVPSYSTVRRVFMIISPICWGQLIQSSILHHPSGKQAEDHVPIDGKTWLSSHFVELEAL